MYTFPCAMTGRRPMPRRWPTIWLPTPKVARVLYPGRADHPDAARAADPWGADRQHGEFRDRRRRGGGQPDGQAAPQLPFAPTLGDVGTTLSHPASSSHRALTPEARAALGISDGFFRVSVGIEEIDLLTSDFDMGLAAV
jgi:cystathionine gamma-synthase